MAKITVKFTAKEAKENKGYKKRIFEFDKVGNVFFECSNTRKEFGGVLLNSTHRLTISCDLIKGTTIAVPRKKKRLIKKC